MFQSLLLFPRMSLLLGAGPRASLQRPLLASQSLSHMDSSQLTGQSWMTSWRSFTGSASDPRTEKSRVSWAQAKTRTAAASRPRTASVGPPLQASGREWKNPWPDKKDLNDWAVFFLPHTLRHPCTALLGSCKSEPHDTNTT